MPWSWVPAAIAAEAAGDGNPLIEVLRQGHGLLSVHDFAKALASGEIELLLLPNRCAALVAWGMCGEGRAMSILTVAGHKPYWDCGLDMLEHAAAERGAEVVMAIAYAGWLGLARRHGYDVAKRIIMRKFLP